MEQCKICNCSFLFREIYGRRCELNRKKTHEEYVNEVKKTNPSIVVLGKYDGSKTKISHHCNICNNEWNAIPSNILEGAGCPKCYIINRSNEYRKTHEEYAKEVKIKNPDIKVIGKYNGNKIKILHHCNICNNEWSASPNNILQRTRCPKCCSKCGKTHEEYVEEVKVKNQNIKVIGKYINIRTKIKHRCKVCNHEWSVLPTNILKGTGCPKCYEEIRGSKCRKTHDEYIEELKKINQNIEVVDTYVNAETNILHKCKVCGAIWNPSPKNILMGGGCPDCANKKNGERTRKTHLEYKKELQEKNPDIEVIGIYIDAKTKIAHKCKICGTIWDTTPPSMLRKSGCIKCGNNKKIEKLTKTNENFISELKFKNPNIKILSKYIGANKPIDCECLICNNKWEISHAQNLLRGNCCPECAENSRGEVLVKNYLDNKYHDYSTQKKFSGLKGIGGGLLSYDFYIQKYNLLIEYQGNQHYESVDYFGGEDQFKKQQEHDKRKRDYAKLHNINLLEIRYDEDVNTALDNYFNNINNSNNLNSESLETVMPIIAM